MADVYDAVVMLTWSNWHTEPRSNRYHYATRFAKHWPVYFVQSTASGPNGKTEEKVDGHDITIVHANGDYGDAQTERLKEFLARKGVRRPLYWVYNPCYIDFIERHPGITHVYHATEDYLGVHAEMPQADDFLVGLFRRLLQRVDLAIAVTESVARSTKVHGNYDGPLIVLRNGCDDTHWRNALPTAPTPDEKIIFYQGGVNARLDFKLLIELSELLPDWKLWICGSAAHATQPDWNLLCSRPNVQAFGQVHPDKIAELQARASVGIIPFRQITLMKVSLPLKAYEYVASGLPVVTIPIDELDREPDLFVPATTAKAFAERIVALAPTRWDPALTTRRLAAARRVSYDVRFSELMQRLSNITDLRGKLTSKLNVLVLYDDGSAHVATVREHLETFSRYSRHNVHFLPATVEHPFPPIDSEADFGAFDVLILHYSVRISTTHHLPEILAKAVEKFTGPKIAFMQDEYDTPDIARAWLDRLKFDVLFSCVPERDVDKVYPKARYPWMRVVQTLTGFAPDDAMIDLYRRPISDRSVVIGYRGRQLEHQYGDLGQEKYIIGVEVRERAVARGMNVDIEVENTKRIYGSSWYEFLAGARATLGTESGSNVFDDDGSLVKLARANPDMPYAEFREKYLQGREGPIHMNQISPKIFEAIELRVALVLFDGEYSGVVQPELHYIPLRKDFSNLEEVLDKLEDLAFVEQMTERAYEDIIASGRYSYAAFATGLDAEIDAAAIRKGVRYPRATLVSVPAVMVTDRGAEAYAAPPAFLPSNTVLSAQCPRPRLWELLSPAVASIPVVEQPAVQNRSRLSLLAERMRQMRGAGPVVDTLAAAWRRAPSGFKSALVRVVG